MRSYTWVNQEAVPPTFKVLRTASDTSCWRVMKEGTDVELIMAED